MNKFKRSVVFSLSMLGCFSGAANAESITSDSIFSTPKIAAQNSYFDGVDYKVYGGLGTDGVKLGFGFSNPDLYSKWGFRAEYSGYTYKKDFEESGVNYEGELTLGGLSALVDYFPFGRSFHLTTGVGFLNTELDLLASGTGKSVTIGNSSTVLGPSDFVRANVGFSASPYVGLGYGHAPRGDKGVYLYSDLGVYIVDGKTSLTTSNGVRAAVGEDNIARERNQLSDDVGGISVIPSANFGLGFRF